MASDPTLRDLQGEIEYEIKLFDKNSREKAARNRVAEEDYVFEHEGTIIDDGRDAEEGKIDELLCWWYCDVRCVVYYFYFIFVSCSSSTIFVLTFLEFVLT